MKRIFRAFTVHAHFISSSIKTHIHHDSGLAKFKSTLPDGRDPPDYKIANSDSVA